MDSAQLIANSMPFLMAYLVQVLKPGIAVIARNTLKVVLPDTISLDDDMKEIAVDLAVHFYRQLSFFIAVLLSTVAALGLSMSANAPLPGFLSVFALLGVSAGWVLRWNTLAASTAEERRSRENEMSVASYAITTLMLLSTLTARWS